MRIVAATVAVVLLAGCGGGGSEPLPTVPPNITAVIFIPTAPAPGATETNGGGSNRFSVEDPTGDCQTN